MTLTTFLACFSKGENETMLDRKLVSTRYRTHNHQVMMTRSLLSHPGGTREFWNLMRCHYTEEIVFRIVLLQYFKRFDFTQLCWSIHLEFSLAWHAYGKHDCFPDLSHNISISECNTFVSAYILYEYLQQCCTHPLSVIIGSCVT